MDQELGRYCHPFSLCAHDLHGAPAHRLRSGQRPNPTLAGRKGGLLCIDSNGNAKEPTAEDCAGIRRRVHERLPQRKPSA